MKPHHVKLKNIESYNILINNISNNNANNFNNETKLNGHKYSNSTIPVFKNSHKRIIINRNNLLKRSDDITHKKNTQISFSNKSVNTSNIKVKDYSKINCLITEGNKNLFLNDNNLNCNNQNILLKNFLDENLENENIKENNKFNSNLNNISRFKNIERYSLIEKYLDSIKKYKKPIFKRKQQIISNIINSSEKEFLKTKGIRNKINITFSPIKLNEKKYRMSYKKLPKIMKAVEDNEDLNYIREINKKAKYCFFKFQFNKSENKKKEINSILNNVNKDIQFTFDVLRDKTIKSFEN